jgi:arabinogalactan oligomer/maltooligosaccharide transport system substrate-binding protein
MGTQKKQFVNGTLFNNGDSCMFKNKILLFLLLISSIFLIIPVKGETNAVDINFWYIEPDETDNTLLNLVNNFGTSVGVNVTVTRLPIDGAKEQFKAASLNGSAPDLIQGYATWIPELVTNGLISAVDEEDFVTDFMSESLRAVSFYEIVDDIINPNNVLTYGFPQRVDTQAFLYSKSVASSMGAMIPTSDQSWDTTEFKTAITKLNDQSDPGNKKYGFSFTDLPAGAEPIFYGNNGEKFSDYTVDRAHIAIEIDESTNALQFMYDVVQTNRLTPDYSDQGTTNTFSHFAGIGDVASTFGFAAEIKNYLSGSQFLDPANLGIAPVPMNSGATGAPIQVMALMVSDSSSIDEKATSIELAKALTDEQAMVKNAKDEFLLPSSLSAFNHADLTSNSIVQDFKNLLVHIRELPISKYWDLTQEGFAIEVGEMLNGDQNGTTAAVAIRIRWSFALPASAGIPPILPFEEETTIPSSTDTTTDETTSTTTQGTPGFEILIFTLGISIALIRRKKVIP